MDAFVDAAEEVIWNKIVKGDTSAESFDEPTLFSSGIYQEEETAKKEFNDMDDDKNALVDKKEFDGFVDGAFDAAMAEKNK